MGDILRDPNYSTKPHFFGVKVYGALFSSVIGYMYIEIHVCIGWTVDLVFLDNDEHTHPTYTPKIGNRWRSHQFPTERQPSIARRNNDS